MRLFQMKISNILIYYLEKDTLGDLNVIFTQKLKTTLNNALGTWFKH